MIDTRDEFQGLFSIYAAVLLAVVAIVFAAVFFALVRYRRRPGRAPSARSDSKVVELAWGCLVALVAGVLVFFTLTTEADVDSVSASPGLRIEVTGFQWGWRFAYPGSGVSVVGNQERPPVVAVPAGTTVRLTLRSRDVVHAFWIPALRFKRDAFPTFDNRFDLVFEHEGTYAGRCAEYCGLHHADMGFQVVAVTPERFQAWLAERGGGE